MRYDSDILYRPPGEWKSYLLQCTIGCSYNKCTFCAMYKEKKFRIRPVEEILEDIDMARDYYGPGLKRVFLMDGDAVIMKTDDLIRVLRKLYDTFPALEKVTTYAGPRSTLAKSPEELRAIREAESYNGPSIVICYCPCIEHGMKASMGLSQLEKKAVECGYWHLYRYDPRLKAEGKNPFTLDSKAPTGDFQQFLLGENRYASLKLSFPEKAQELYEKAERDAKERLESYLRLAEK